MTWSRVTSLEAVEQYTDSCQMVIDVLNPNPKSRSMEVGIRDLRSWTVDKIWSATASPVSDSTNQD